MKSMYKMFLSFLVIYSMHTFAQPPKKPVSVYSEDHLNIMVTDEQPEFNLELKSNPTTGFSWFLREYNTDLITPVKRTFQAGERKLIGAPGKEIWTFRVKPKGFIVPQQTTLRMIYTRPFQGNDNARQVVFRISTLTK